MFEVAATSIKRKIDNREYAEAMDLIEKLRGTLDDSKKGDDATEFYQHKSACHSMSGDCHFGMDKLERSLREYEQALKWITKVYSPTEYPCMSILFKIERLLSHMYTIEEKSLQYDKRWQAGLLMQAEDWLESGVYQQPQVQAEANENLEKLWQKQVVRQKKIKKKANDQKKGFSSADILDAVLKVVRSNQGPLIVVSTLFMAVACCQIFMHAAKLYTEMQDDPLLSSVVGSKDPSRKPLNKERALKKADGNTFSLAGQTEQLLFHTNKALITIGKKVYTLPYVSDPRSVQEFFSLTLTTTLSRCLWLKRTDLGLQLPSGTVLFDRECPEFELSSVVGSFLKDWDRSPDSPYPKQISYKEPFSGAVRTAKFIDLLGNSSPEGWLRSQANGRGLTKGTVVCFKNARFKSNQKTIETPLGIAIGETPGSRLPLGNNGSTIMSIANTPDLEAVVKYGGIVISNDPANLRDLSGLTWIAFVLALFLLSSFRRLNAGLRHITRILAGCAFAGLVLFLYHNFHL